MKIILEFDLSVQAQLEIFARYMERDLNEDPEKMTAKRFKEIIKHML